MVYMGIPPLGFLFLFYDKWWGDASIGRRGVCIGSGWGERLSFLVFFWGRMSDYGIIFGIVLDDFQGDAWYGYYIL